MSIQQVGSITVESFDFTKDLQLYGANTGVWGILDAYQQPAGYWDFCFHIYTGENAHDVVMPLTGGCYKSQAVCIRKAAEYLEQVLAYLAGRAA